MALHAAGRRRKRKLKAEINVVPYIDVMLVLLIIFMVTAPLLNLGTDISLPQSRAKSLQTPQDPVVVSIYADGGYALMLERGRNRTIDAKDLGTGRSQQVKVTPTSGLDKNEIDRIIKEGERYEATDAVRRELAELRNAAETLLYTTDAALEGYVDLVDADTLEDTRESAKRLRTLVDSQGDIQSLRSAYQDLEARTFQLAEKLYGS